MKNAPRISDTEWEIMRIVWASRPLTAAEIIERLSAADPEWHPKTARTLLSRLVQKGAMSYEERGRAYVYSPLVSEQECVASASDSFLERVFGGSLQPMLAHFVNRQRLSDEELAKLRRLLEKSLETKSKPTGKTWKA